MAKSPEYSPAKLGRILTELEYKFNTVDASLGSAFSKAIEGETIIVGGFLNTELIAADSILAKHIKAGEVTSDKLSVNSLSAISADLGEVTSGTITGGTINGGTINGTTINGSEFFSSAQGEDYGVKIKRGTIRATYPDDKEVISIGGLIAGKGEGFFRYGGDVRAQEILSLHTADGTGSVDIYGDVIELWGWVQLYNCKQIQTGWGWVYGDQWNSISFHREFENIPKVWITSEDGANIPSNGKVRNITRTGFEAKLEGTLNGSLHNYLAIEGTFV